MPETTPDPMPHPTLTNAELTAEKEAQIASGFKAPPIKGYQDVSAAKQEAVNGNKVTEEIILRHLDHLAALDGVDKRWLAIGRTHMEQAWMAINRSIFQPQRIKLPEDKP